MFNIEKKKNGARRSLTSGTMVSEGGRCLWVQTLINSNEGKGWDMSSGLNHDEWY